MSSRKRSRVAQLVGRFGAAELARRVGVSDSTVRRWARDGTPRARQEDLRAVERRSEAARQAARVRLERRGEATPRTRPERPRAPLLTPRQREHVERAMVEASRPRGITLSPRERDQIAEQRELATREIARLQALVKKPAKKPRKKKKKPEPPVDLDVIEERFEDEIDEEVQRFEQVVEDEIEAAERLAIQEEERAPKPEPLVEEDEEPATPEDVYPLPVRRLDFFKQHDRTELEGVSKIHFDPESGRIYGTNDQGQKVAAYLFTNEDGQPKQGPDSLRWALANKLDEYLSWVNKAIREKYGDSNMRGAFGRFTQPGRAA